MRPVLFFTQMILREYTVAKPDYSEAKIVLAMVRIYKALP